MTAADGAPAPIILMRDVEKRFGAVLANRGASLEVAPAEVHALVGENGAGKSTLMRLLAGLYPPDAGRIEVNGQNVTGWTTAEAIDAGIGMVHQHFMLVPTLTVAENVVLGREPTRGIAVDMARAIVEVRDIGEQFGLRIDPRRMVAELSVGEAQRVEILKTLFRGARILILDEPTAVLSPPEVRDLWAVLRRLRDGGGTIILITHKLDEVMDVSDRITIMRQGRTVARLRTTDATPAEIARAMVGRDVDLGSRGRAPSGQAEGRAPVSHSRLPILRVTDLSVRGSRGQLVVDRLSLAIGPGEIFGIAGVEGNGQTELVEAIAGLRPAESGAIALLNGGGAEHDVTRSTVRARADLGMAHIPEDRHRRGLILDYSVADNLILGAQHRFGGRRAGPLASLDRARIDANAAEQVRRFDVRPPDARLPVRALSGGNQQKVVIAREMGSDFSLLLASQPTRGVDVGAIEFIHAQLRAAREAGKAVLLVSAELGEILALADRVAVMYRGRLVATMPRAEASEEALGPLMTGASGPEAGAA